MADEAFAGGDDYLAVWQRGFVEQILNPDLKYIKAFVNTNIRIISHNAWTSIHYVIFYT